MSWFIEKCDVNEYPIKLVECIKPSQNKILKEIIDTYHSYKKFVSMPTRRIHFLVYETVSGNLVGAIGISSATIAIACRDKYIGWDNVTRLKNLGKLANNSRCCIIQKNTTIQNVGSMTLKRLEIDGGKRWLEKYNEPLIMIETFVQPERETDYKGNAKRNGSIYRASNYIEIGITSGHSIKKCPVALWQKEDSARGELARSNPEEALKKHGPQYEGKQFNIEKSLPKIMFVKPLVKNWKEILNG